VDWHSDLSGVWRSRDIPVAAGLLQTNLAELGDSPRGYSRQQLRDMANAIEDVNARVERGASAEELMRLRTSPRDDERRAGEAFVAVFRGRESAHPLRAHFVDGQLLVDAGNHRIRAAQEAGDRPLPVTVRARTDREIDLVESHSRAAIGIERYDRLKVVHERVRGDRDTRRERGSANERGR
jgi:ParB-like nuclease domain